MAPELLNALDSEDLFRIASQIETIAKDRKWSDSALAREVASIGSTKTFRKILGRDFSEMDVERQLANYQSALLFLENIAAPNAQEDLYNDLHAAAELRRVFIDVSKETGIARCVFLVGASGTGKSSARAVIMRTFRDSIRSVEATDGWNGSPMAFLGAILKATGCNERPLVLADRMEKAIDKLKETKISLMIEEAHHLGVRNLNIVKTLINQTPTVLFLIANDTLWRRLETAAYEDISQLRQNRLAEKIDLGKVVQPEDVKKLLQRRVIWEIPFERLDLKMILEKAAAYGRLAFVREVCLRISRDCGKRLATQQDLIEAVQAEVKSR